MIVLVMGVSGAGKTAIGQRLGRRLGFRFIDADDHHPPENVAKMAAGIPLDDADRAPWLKTLNRILLEQKDAVIACSALKQRYRDTLLAGIPDTRIVFLKGSRDLIRGRLEARKHRYMPASLLDSQLAALEPPQNAIEIDVNEDPDGCASRIFAAVR